MLNSLVIFILLLLNSLCVDYSYLNIDTFKQDCTIDYRYDVAVCGNQFHVCHGFVKSVKVTSSDSSANESAVEGLNISDYGACDDWCEHKPCGIEWRKVSSDNKTKYIDKKHESLGTNSLTGSVNEHSFGRFIIKPQSVSSNLIDNDFTAKNCKDHIVGVPNGIIMLARKMSSEASRHLEPSGVNRITISYSNWSTNGASKDKTSQISVSTVISTNSAAGRSGNETIEIFNDGTEMERTLKRPDFVRAKNGTQPWDQLHFFFGERAREDAYQKTEARDNPYSIICRIHAAKGDRVCSGTLVALSWMLTAAHCVVDDKAREIQAFAGVAVNIFDEMRKKRMPAGAQMRMSRVYFSHPKYDPHEPSVDYDVALVKFEPGFERTEFVRPAKVVSSPWEYNGYKKCILTSFGTVRMERDSPDDYVRKTQVVEVKKPCECYRQLQRGMGEAAASRYVCMRPKRDWGICEGDSGGGLVCDGQVAAVVSFALSMSHIGCKVSTGRRRHRDTDGMCGGADTLDIYQDLYPSLSWVKKSAAIAEDSDEPEPNGARAWRASKGVCCLLFVLLGARLNLAQSFGL